MKVIELINSKTEMSEILFVPVREEDFKYSLNGILLEVTGWGSIREQEPCDANFIAEVGVKWDGCSHWRFFGEDYMNDTEHEDDIDGYYHICGFDSYISFMRGMVFAYQLAIDKVESFDKQFEIPVYEKFKNSLNLLEGYEVKTNEYSEDNSPYWRIKDWIKE